MMTHARLAILVLVSLLLMLLPGCGAGWNHTSDSSLERYFRRHEAQFEALCAEVQADSQLKTLERGAVTYAGKRVEVTDGDLSVVQRSGLARERWEHYQKELTNLEIRGIFKGDSDVEFRVDSGSLWNGDSYKGYQCTSTAPSHIRNSLDLYRRSDRDKDKSGGWSVFKRLKRNWYLYLFVNG